MSGKAAGATFEHIDASTERTNRLLQGACVIAKQRWWPALVLALLTAAMAAIALLSHQLLVSRADNVAPSEGFYGSVAQYQIAHHRLKQELRAIAAGEPPNPEALTRSAAVLASRASVGFPASLPVGRARPPSRQHRQVRPGRADPIAVHQARAVTGLHARRRPGTAVARGWPRLRGCRFPLKLSPLIFHLAQMTPSSCHQLQALSVPGQGIIDLCSAGILKMPAAAGSMSKSKLMDSVFLRIAKPTPAVLRAGPPEQWKMLLAINA